MRSGGFGVVVWGFACWIVCTHIGLLMTSNVIFGNILALLASFNSTLGVGSSCKKERQPPTHED